MQKQKEQSAKLDELIEQENPASHSHGRLKKGKMSKAFEAALDAVENMDKTKKN